MNRRSFISTITALAGIVLAKLKAPVATSTDHLAATYTGDFRQATLSGKHYYFTPDGIYICDNTGLYKLTTDGERVA